MQKTNVQEKAEYLIGDVARMVGLSRDALRFYEKKGIINARKKDNGYRYYSEDDIYKLMYILYQRKMNTSLEEIEGLMSGGRSMESRRKRIKQRMAEEEETIRMHQQAIARLKLVQRDMDHIEESLNRYSLRRFPKAYIMGQCRDLHHGLREWFRLASTISGLDMTYFYNELTYNGRELTQHGTQLLFYKELEDQLGDAFDSSRYALTEEKMCIYTVLTSRETLPSPEMVSCMVGWGRKHGIEAGGRVYANDMTSFFDEDGATFCLELYMPVRKIVSQI